MQFQLKCVRDVIFCSYWIDFLFIGVIKILVTRLTSLSKMTSSFWNCVLFILTQREKVKLVCATLNEGYLRATHRDCRSTKPLRLFSGNLPAMFNIFRNWLFIIFALLLKHFYCIFLIL